MGKKKRLQVMSLSQTFFFKGPTSVFVTSVNPCLIQDNHESGPGTWFLCEVDCVSYRSPAYLLSSSSEDPSADLWLPIYLQTKTPACWPCCVHNSWSLLYRQWFRRPAMQSGLTDSGHLGVKCRAQKLGKEEFQRMVDFSWGSMDECGCTPDWA